MSEPGSEWKHSTAVALVLGAALGSNWALAANGPDQAAALARFENERSVCLSGLSNQDQATCLREANAAFAEAKRGALDDGSVDYIGNSLKRCARLPDEDREDCEARMSGLGTTSGSVAAGGVLRVLVTREVELPDEVQ